MNYFQYMEQKTQPRRVGKMPELAADFVDFTPVDEFMDTFASNTGIVVTPMTPEEIAEWINTMTMTEEKLDEWVRSWGRK